MGAERYIIVNVMFAIVAVIMLCKFKPLHVADHLLIIIIIIIADGLWPRY